MQLSVRDAAQLLGVSEKTVYRWTRNGEIPHTRVNDQYRFHRVELLEWATARRIAVAPEIYQEPGDSASPSLSEALAAGGVFYRLAGDDVGSVLREVVRHLRLPDDVDRDYLYEVMLAREQLGSTALGDGIAIPHPRNPIVLHVPRPTATLCFLEHPVDFRALDGRPVDTLFTLVSPTARGHLHLLSRLAFCLRDTSLRALLAEQAAKDALLQAFREAEGRLPARGEAAGR